MSDSGISAEPSANSEIVAEGGGKRTFLAGSLVYTPWLLAATFFWLLWGEVCLAIAEQVITKLLPVSLRDLKASNTMIGLLAPGLPCILGTALGPVIGSWSDRHRSRLGRRIPFLLLLAPSVALSLLLIGQSGPLGEQLFLRTGNWLQLASPAAGMFIIMAVSAVLFQTTHNFVISVYYYLVRDVIPDGMLGRFYGVARTVGAGAGFAFNRYFLGYAELHRELAYAGIAVFYFVAFFVLCRRVKEGEYPPPPPKLHKDGLASSVTTYVRECYSKPYYVLIYLGQAFYTCSTVCVHTFIVLFAREDIGMSLDSVGKAMAWPFLIGLALYIPFGYVADRIHPLRLQIMALVVLPLISVLNFWGIQGETSFLVWTLVWWVAHYAYMASNGPLLPLLLPAAKYGQFYSAMFILALLGATAASFGGGIFLDLVGDYRYIYVWNFIFNVLSLLVTLMFYGGWKRHGGSTNYRAP